MSGSEAGLAGLGLYRIASANCVLVGLLCLTGAHGHVFAVWDSVVDASGSRVALLMPAVQLAFTGFSNLLLAAAVWRRGSLAIWMALFINVVAAVYFSCLLHQGVTDHPIGLFLAVVAAHSLVLVALKMGLMWPVESARTAGS
ncbi:MAG: hypothetical protein AAF610_07365 [Pseudomonadota bacterium]